MDDGFGFLDDGSLRIPDPDAFPPPASMSPKKGGGCSGGCGGSSATSVADADVVDSIFDEPCCSSCAMGWPCDGTCGGKCGQEQPEEHCCPSCMMGWPCEKDADVQARAELFGYTAECVGETCTWEEMGWAPAELGASWTGSLLLSDPPGALRAIPADPISGSDPRSVSDPTTQAVSCPGVSNNLIMSGSCVGFGPTGSVAKSACIDNLVAAVLAGFDCEGYCLYKSMQGPFPCNKRFGGRPKWKQPECAFHGYFAKLGWVAQCSGLLVFGRVSCECWDEPEVELEL